MHLVLDPKVLYFGTPVVLISTINNNGSANLAPMSSVWFLGRSCMVGLDATSRTTENLIRTGQCVLNLCDPAMVDAVDRLALTTGSPTLPEHKAQKGFRYVPDKFAAAGLTAGAADLVDAPLVLEAPIQLEAEVRSQRPFGAPHADARAIEVAILRSHVDSRLVMRDKPDHIDPLAWDPLIMKFTEFFGCAVSLRSSTLAHGFGMAHDLDQRTANRSIARREADVDSARS